MLPLFSIVTPSLNQKAYIPKTIASVFAQNRSDLEHLVIDGCSNDSTLSILKRSVQEKNQQLHWISELDDGQSAAVNKGWHMARGDILGWLNADDVYLPGALNIISKYFQQHPDVDIIYGDCDYMDESGQILDVYPTHPYDYANLVRFAINYIPQPATFIRRQVVESVGFLDETLHYVMDYDYWLRAGLRHNIAYIPVKLAKMRVHDNSKSIKSLGKFSQELIAIYTKLFNSVDLPDAVRGLEKEAMHHAYYRAAHIAFWAKQPRESYLYGRKALQIKPFSISSWKLLLVANKFGVRFANMLMDNPYFLQSKQKN